MKIDVIIPAYRPGAEFLELIDRLERQTLPVRKILVMNTRSQVDVEKLLADRPEIQVVSLEKNEFDHGGTRDRAARLSEADYLLFLTQDALPADAHLVERLAAAFGDKRVKAAYARQLPKEDCREDVYKRQSGENGYARESPEYGKLWIFQGLLPGKFRIINKIF